MKASVLHDRGLNLIHAARTSRTVFRNRSTYTCHVRQYQCPFYFLSYESVENDRFKTRQA